MKTIRIIARTLCFSLSLCVCLTSSAQTKTDIAQAQSILKSLGFYEGRVDGSWGKLSAAAVTAFQQESGLEISGQLDSATTSALNARNVSVPDPNRKTPKGIVPILEALKEGYVETEVLGSEIRYVRLKLKNKSAGALKVKIPAGTFFVCRGSAQNMVSRVDKVITLSSNEPETYQIETACANKPRDIPGWGDRFDIAPSPHQEELTRLMPVLNEANVDYLTVQAAVWIVTDNANYAALGTLQMGRSRAIGVENVMEGMWFLEKAGIDLKTKSIWKDKDFLLKNVQDKKLKKWLTNHP